MGDMLETGRPNLEEFADTLLALAREDRDVLVVTSDSRGSGKLNGFAAALPEQLIEVGIAEQTLVGVAAGLASTGKNVFAVSPASFLTARALEQIKNDVAYSDHPVNVVGISAGVSYGALGSSGHATLRTPNRANISMPPIPRPPRARATRFKLSVYPMAITRMAPMSSAMARDNRRIRRLCGMREPNTARQPTTKAMSVAMGMPQPRAAGSPAWSAR